MFSELFASEKELYFIGIGGVSMSALAKLMQDLGYRVRGSDRTESDVTKALRRRGIPVSIGEEEEISENVVVYTGAIGASHPQLTRAREAGKRLVARANLLGAAAEEYPHVVSVAGCHGKTSCSSLLSHIFAAAKLPFTCHIGGEDGDFSNYACFGRDYFITEACEYGKSFLSLKSECAIVLNIGRDHMDCYAGEEDLFRSFRKFAQGSKFVVVNAEDSRAMKIPHTASYGLRRGDYRAEELSSDGEKYSFTLTEHGKKLVRIHLNATGKTYVFNALAAAAAARCYKITPDKIKEGLESFRAVKRRFEEVGSFCGVPVVCDYAHHPDELRAAIQTANRVTGGTVRVVFQPHTYSRTRDLMNEFVGVLKETENPIVYRTYAAREPFDLRGSAVELVSRVPEAIYVQSPSQLKKRLAEQVKEGDLILVLGAGDIYETVLSVIKE